MHCFHIGLLLLHDDMQNWVCSMIEACEGFQLLLTSRRILGLAFAGVDDDDDVCEYEFLFEWVEFMDMDDLGPSLLWRIWQSFNDIFASCNTHDGNTGYFSDAALEVSIVGSDNVDLMSLNSVHDAVVSIDTFMTTLQSFPSFVSGDS